MENTTPQTPEVKTKFCKHCGGKIPEAAVVCTLCGCQVEEMKQAEQPNIVINNSNANTNTNVNANIGRAFGARLRNKWVAFFLCLFLVSLERTSTMKAKAVWESFICSPAVCLVLAGLLIFFLCCSSQILTMYKS